MRVSRSQETSGGWDVVIAGAGASGLLAAHALLQRRPRSRILIVDAGRDLADRQRSPSTELGGSGGAGFYLGGRLYLGPATLPVLPLGRAPERMRTVVEGERYLALARRVDAIFRSLGATAEVREGPPERLARAVEEARAVGLEYVTSYPARLLSADERHGVLRTLLAGLAARGATFAYGTMLSGAQRTRDGFRVALTPGGAGEHTTRIATTRSLLLAPGRYGAEWLVQMARELGVEVVALPTAFGVRLELPAATYRPLTEVNPDPRLQLALPDDAIIKTYATCPGGYVAAVERYGRVVASGVPVSASERGPNSTVALLLQPGVEGARGRWQGGDEAARRLNERAPGRLVAQRLGDLRRGIATDDPALAANAVRPSAPDAAGSDLREVYPAAFWDAVDDLLGRIERLAPGIAGENTLLYGPAEERFWHFPTDEQLQTNAPGLFVAGDGPGQSQGVIQAGVAGLLAGEGLADYLA